MTVVTNSKLLSDFLHVRSRTKNLCEPLQVEDYIPQPVAFVSPAKWHLGHTTWFFEEFILQKYLPKYKRYHDDFSFMFNSYYQQMGERVLRVNRGNMSRPSVKDVYEYRKYVDQAMGDLLTLDSLSDEILELVELGNNHEQQHQELLITDVKYILGHQPLFPVYKPGYSLVKTVEQDEEWVSFSEGITEIGHDGNGFSYDNERGRHKVYLPSFQVRQRLVTNQEYQYFIDDGGYSNATLWLDDGWSWVERNGIKAPMYWHRMDGKWKQYTLSGLQDVEPNQAVCHINHYEAWAFAEWNGLRLPTEFEWEHAADILSWGSRWEWTDSAYLPYPGFRKEEGAVGEYNGKFMVNQKVLRGGSAATASGHSRKTYRNFFQPEHQWQCTGIRLARTI